MKPRSCLGVFLVLCLFLIGIFFLPGTVSGGSNLVTVTPTSLNLIEGESATIELIFNGTLSGEDTVEVALHTDPLCKLEEGINKVIFDANTTRVSVTVTATNNNRIEAPSYPCAVVTDSTTSTNPSFQYHEVEDVSILIRENDATMGIAKKSDAVEGESDAAGSFTITVNPKLPVDVGVQIFVSGTASVGTDFDIPDDWVPDPLAPTQRFKITIPAETASFQLDIPVLDDNHVEVSETVSVTLEKFFPVNLPGSTVGLSSSQAEFSITDDDTAQVTVEKTSDASEAGLSGQFTIKLSAPAVSLVRVYFSLPFLQGRAKEGIDYEEILPTHSVVIPAGETSRPVNIIPINDDEQEGDETVMIRLDSVTDNLSSPGRISIGTPSTASLTLKDDDLPVVSVVKVQDGAEGGQAGQFLLLLSEPVAENVVVDVAFSGTADAEDYTALPASVTLPAGQTSQVISVNMQDDDLLEGAEDLKVTLIKTNNGRLSAVAEPPANEAVLTILDNDEAAVGIYKNADAAEPDINNFFTVAIPKRVTADVVVYYTVTGQAEPGEDYKALSGSVVIPANQYTAEIKIEVMDDEIVEGSEDVQLTLTGTDHPQVTVSSTASASLMLMDNDIAEVSIRRVADAEEPGTNGAFQVSMTQAADVDVTVAYNVSGSAAAGSDYAQLSGQVIIPQGEKEAEISVLVKDDALVEAAEDLVVTLTGTDNARVMVGTQAEASLMILSEDLAQVRMEKKPNGDAGEPDKAGTFTIKLSNPVSVPLTVNYSEAGGTAVRGVDFKPLSGVITIPAGATAVDISLSVLDDDVFEGTETVRITLTKVSGSPLVSLAAAPGNTVELAIIDNEMPYVSIVPAKNVSLSEAGQPFTFTIILSKLVAGDLTVNYQVSGTATAGEDFLPLSGSVKIENGKTTAAVRLTPKRDDKFEGDETIIITLTSVNHSGVSIGSEKTITIILQDDLVIYLPFINRQGGPAN